jgi:hypothetical protein
MSTLLPIARPNPHATAALSTSPISCLRFILTLKKEEIEQFQREKRWQLDTQIKEKRISPKQITIQQWLIQPSASNQHAQRSGPSKSGQLHPTTTLHLDFPLALPKGIRNDTRNLALQIVKYVKPFLLLKKMYVYQHSGKC